MTEQRPPRFGAVAAVRREAQKFLRGVVGITTREHTEQTRVGQRSTKYEDLTSVSVRFE